jgi:hypothetical protein
MVVMNAITKLAKVILQNLLLLKMKRLSFIFAELKLQEFIIAYVLVLLLVDELSDLVFGEYFLGSCDFGEFSIFGIDLLKFVLIL